jgi:hypothetical protein
MPRTIRILHFSPSTATGRHDSHRAALGITWFAQAALTEFNLPHRVDLIWALPAISSKESVHGLLGSGDVLVIATPTYGQGSPWFVRKFFELTPGCGLWGKPATAFATSGGNHTGGETAVGDCLRSLQGIGASTFSFAQKTLVFGTNQKFARDGEFDVIDGWFMRQFARTLVLQAILRDRPDNANEWASRLGLRSDYYNDFPTQSALGGLVGNCIRLLNAPLADAAAGYPALEHRLGFSCTPPDASRLPFSELLPAPPNELLTA